VLFISVLSTALWAVNPIQIQAVTYIVQRMASMAAMFSILAINYYLRARLNTSTKKQIRFYLACFCSFMLAIMSKENAVLLLPSLLLVEIVFFQDLSELKHKITKHLLLLSVMAFLILLISVAFISHGTFDFLVVGYQSRPFSLLERVMTQPRILLFYISQIFYPLPDRLSITHDILLSKSLLSPWSTLPAMAAILAAIVFAVSQITKRPLVAFAILFFFLNHAIESTFLPLELIFEHRNYLPSLFIFVPIAAAMSYLLKYYQSRNRTLYGLLSVFMILVIIGLGSFTYVRNRDWRTETTLWRDAMKKAPSDSRPPVNLAIQLAWGTKPTPLDYDVALTLFENAKSQFMAHRFLITDIYNNMGSIYYHTGQYQLAVQTHKAGLDINPGFLKMRYDLISSLIMLGKWEEGAIHIDRLIANRENFIDSDYFKLKGFILLWQRQPEKALTYFRKALKMEPNNRAVLLNTGVSLSMLGKTDQATLFLDRARQLAPGDIRPIFALIENAVRADDPMKVDRYVQQLFARVSIQKILQGLHLFTNNYRTAPMATELIAPAIKKRLTAIPEEIDRQMRLIRNDHDDVNTEQRSQ
jgi:protein O-mannosyl-transferase